MKKRIITGLALFVAFLVLAVLDIFWLNFLIFAAILVVAVLESLNLYGIKERSLVIIALIFFSIIPFVSGIQDIFKIIILNLVVVASVLAYIKSDNLKFILPFIYPVASIFMLFGIYQSYGISALFWLIFSVIASDSGAYFVGKFFGKRSFSPSSPNKTLEGVIGGLIIGIAFGVISGLFLMDMAFVIMVLCSLSVVIFSIFGDLFESYLKRLAGVKDSGVILGEQGGILDRMDGYLFGVLAMYMVLI